MNDSRPSPFRRPSFRRRAFTLLEIMLAVLILALMAVAIYRFVRGTMVALTVSVEDTEDQLAEERLVDLVQESLYNISPKDTASLLGYSLKLSNRNLDTLEWRSRGGASLMTSACEGDYRVQLMIVPLKDNSSKYEIVLRRYPVPVDAAGNIISGGNNDNNYTTVPLLENADGMMIRYWDGRLNQAVDKWPDQAVRPTFVQLSIWRNGDPIPYEACLTVPAAQTQQQ